MLACDALYLCAGLGAYTVKQHFDFEVWFQAFLGPALEVLVSTMQTTAGQVRFVRGPLLVLGFEMSLGSSQVNVFFFFFISFFVFCFFVVHFPL